MSDTSFFFFFFSEAFFLENQKLEWFSDSNSKWTNPLQLHTNRIEPTTLNHDN